MLEMFVKEEMSATLTSVLEKWSRLQGMPQHQAMLGYMTIIKEWPGYGSTLFDVEVCIVSLWLWACGRITKISKGSLSITAITTMYIVGPP